ncbi:type II secretion system F family protein [Tundrisphaera lichenicola]|uniref:type II secretion system F family protein n=1 Tax=Tundrisphaera lichenicola TaxID=2029860 RepID=UPI003EBAB45C
MNDEIKSLVRAGIPLERGLFRSSDELGSQTGAIARELGDRMALGESLPEALSRSRFALSDLYRAVVVAGIRSGRLAEALEGMAVVTRGYAESRRAVGLALLYPTIVLTLAYGLALGFILGVVPRIIGAYRSLGIEPMGLLNFLHRVGDLVTYWGPVIPVLLIVSILRWVWSGRSVALDTGQSGNWLNRFPLVGSMVAGFRNANFADLLALLVDHHVPLDEALPLAGQASGDPDIRRCSNEFAERIRRGDESIPTSSTGYRVLPPLLSWMLSAGHRQGDLASGLRHVAKNYRKKAESRLEIIRSALPVVLMLTLGAGTVFLYGLLLFLPLTNLYEGLALLIP